MARLPAGRASTLVRRLWPVALAAYERWRELPPEEKERYRQMARGDAQRGRDAYGRVRPRGRGPGQPL
jgi:HMG-box domain